MVTTLTTHFVALELPPFVKNCLEKPVLLLFPYYQLKYELSPFRIRLFLTFSSLKGVKREQKKKKQCYSSVTWVIRSSKELFIVLLSVGIHNDGTPTTSLDCLGICYYKRSVKHLLKMLTKSDSTSISHSISENMFNTSISGKWKPFLLRTRTVLQHCTLLHFKVNQQKETNKRTYLLA